MAARPRYYGVYVGVMALLALHVQKDSGVTSYYLNGLRPVFESLKSKENSHDRGHAVTCYSCSSKHNEACLKPDVNEYTPAHCDITMLDQMRTNARNISTDYDKIFEVDSAHLGGVDLICLKVVVQEGNKKYVLRGCQLGLYSTLDICSMLQKTSTGMYKLLHCSKCNRDACNSSQSSFHFNTALTLICLVFYRAVVGL